MIHGFIFGFILVYALFRLIGAAIDTRHPKPCARPPVRP